MTALAEAPSNYRTAPPKGFNSESAKAAQAKSAQRQRELSTIAKALSPRPLHNQFARLAHLRRAQRKLITQAMAECDSAKCLEAAKSARELFEMEMELLGRRPLKAGKVVKGLTAEQTRKALQLPDAATLPRPDSMDTAPKDYDPLAGLPYNPAGGNTSFTPMDPGATKQIEPTAAPGNKTGTVPTV